MIVEYQAINKTGAIVNDTIVVDDPADATAELIRRGLTPIKVHAESGGGDGAFNLLGRLKGLQQKSMLADPRRASRKHLPFYTSQLAILLETGTQVAPSLVAIERQMTDPHWKQLIAEMRRHVEEGGTLTSATSLYPQVFDSVYVSMISAGEASGNLSRILNRLADLARQADRLRNKIISAMIYPALLIGISFVVMIILAFYVIPRFTGIFTELNVSLPASTTMMLGMSTFVRENLILTLIAFGGLIAGLMYWLKSRPGKYFVDKMTLKVPIIGPLASSLIIARIFRILGLLVESSVPLLEALELTRHTTSNHLYTDVIQKAHDSVLHGQSMHEVFLYSRLVPPSIAQMVHTGEENGQVGKVMSMLADYLDDRNETQINMLTSIMEPFILIIMGCLIGTMVFSLVLPMFDLSNISGM